MHKNILKKEYPLSAKSPKIVWEMISNAAGLQKWLADVVKQEGDLLTFTWGHPWTERDTKVSKLLELEKYSHIKMKWDYQEDDPEAYWEMRIEQSELTGQLNLLITDYSSVFFDYAILKRPVLLFMYDLELYQGQLRDFYIDLDDLPFPILRKQEELEQAILDQLNGGFRYTETYEKFNRTYTPMDDGKASQRVLKEIFPE